MKTSFIHRYKDMLALGALAIVFMTVTSTEPRATLTASVIGVVCALLLATVIDLVIAKGRARQRR